MYDRGSIEALYLLSSTGSEMKNEVSVSLASIKKDISAGLKNLSARLGVVLPDSGPDEARRGAILDGIFAHIEFSAHDGGRFGLTSEAVSKGSIGKKELAAIERHLNILLDADAVGRPVLAEEIKQFAESVFDEAAKAE